MDKILSLEIIERFQYLNDYGYDLWLDETLLNKTIKENENMINFNDLTNNL